jgi:hypothetical protein
VSTLVAVLVAAVLAVAGCAATAPTPAPAPPPPTLGERIERLPGQIIGVNAQWQQLLVTKAVTPAEYKPWEGWARRTQIALPALVRQWRLVRNGVDPPGEVYVDSEVGRLERELGRYRRQALEYEQRGGR